MDVQKLIPRQTLAEKLSDDIIDYIMQKDLQPGDKLPNEYEFAEILNAGRGSVREAFKALSSRNIVEIRQGAGTFVSEKRGVADDPLGFSFVKNREKLAHDLLEIRLLIEPPIAALAAQNATEEDINDIVSLCEETEQLIRTGGDHAQKDIELHTKLAQSSKNIVVPRLIPIINSSIELFIDLTERSLLQETIDIHKEIALAVSRHDAVAAQDSMYLHLIYNRRRLNYRQP